MKKYVRLWDVNICDMTCKNAYISQQSLAYRLVGINLFEY